MSEWEETRIGECCDVKGGKRLPKGEALLATPTSHPYVRVVDLQEGRINSADLQYVPETVFPQIKRYTVDSSNIVISIVGTIGSVAVVPAELAGANLTENAAKIVPKNDDVDPRFLYYYLKSAGGQSAIRARTVGSTQPKLALFRIKDIPFPKPPIDKQHRIVHILGSLDDKIELNQRMNRTLEAIARAIFKSWFVDFDPVHAKAEGRKPVCMDPETAALFPDSFEDSPLGVVPKGWEVSTVGDEFDVTMGQSPPGSTYNESGDGLLFFQGRRDFGFRFPTKRVFCTAPRRIAEEGDTLVSVRAPVGDVNMAPAQLCLGRGLAGVRHTNGNRSYTYYSMLSLRERFRAYESEGTVFGAINKGQFSDLDWVNPGDSLIETFERRLFAADETIRSNELACACLSSIRDGLLPKLMSGELLTPREESCYED
jgi:type I restriction enzyme S subunit